MISKLEMRWLLARTDWHFRRFMDTVLLGSPEQRARASVGPL